jgi:hypothetical protein
MTGMQRVRTSPFYPFLATLISSRPGIGNELAFDLRLISLTRSRLTELSKDYASMEFNLWPTEPRR